MQIIGVSGDGIGAGKTTFCRRFTCEVWSLAGALRGELKKICPEYDWFNRTQAYKETRFKHKGRIIDKLQVQDGDIGDMPTVRDALIIYGQWQCRDDNNYWVRQLSTRLADRMNIADGVKIIGIDDVRKVNEVNYLREVYKNRFTHIHMNTIGAIHEAVFDNEELAKLADYTVSWDKGEKI